MTTSSTMDPDLLKILCCPETRQPLRVADPAFVDALNRRIAAGQVRTRAGKPVTVPCESALLREDGAVAYPVRHGLPILLIAEAIAVNPD